MGSCCEWTTREIKLVENWIEDAIVNSVMFVSEIAYNHNMSKTKRLMLIQALVESESTIIKRLFDKKPEETLMEGLKKNGFLD